MATLPPGITKKPPEGGIVKGTFQLTVPAGTSTEAIVSAIKQALKPFKSPQTIEMVSAEFIEE
jgi:hypothetical protein